MKTENKQRELAFLRYLNALEDGDAVAIINFLEEAEQDEKLRQMMLDYHDEQEQQIEEKPMKTIIPFKLKREQTRRIIQTASISAVAALVLVTVGMMGIFVGMRQPSAIADVQNCSVTLANEDNTVNLIGGEDIESAIRVGVNNPFTLYLNTGQASEGYQVTFEGLRAIISYDDLVIEGDCSQERVVSIYPMGELGQSCEIDLEPIKFPMRIQGFLTSLYLASLPAINTSIVFDRLNEDGYPIIADTFTGSIPLEALHLTGDCMNYPLLYVPPRSDDNRLSDNITETDGYILQIDSVRVREQQFENGIMFYIEAIDDIWVATQDIQGRRAWMAIGATYGSINRLNSEITDDIPDGLYAPESDLFMPVWLNFASPGSGSGELQMLKDGLGWAISEPIIYMADYEHPGLTEENVGEFLEEFPREGFSLLNLSAHYIESSTGDVYKFYEDPYSSTVTWRIVGEED